MTKTIFRSTPHSGKRIPLIVSLEVFSCLCCILLIGPAHAEPRVLGWLESVYLRPTQDRLVAKLDTGARTSSISATNIQLMEKDGETWVGFTIPSKDKAYSGIYLERPLSRKTRVKEHLGKSKARYVVELDICLAGKFYTAEFTLANRENFNYRVILGRGMLRGNIVVDPGQKFIGGHTCKTLLAGKTKP